MDVHQLPLDLEIIRLYPWTRLFSIFQGLTLVFFVWFLSVAIVFQEKIFDEKFFSVAAV
jgi:succinate dehydrogenase/fumarate reductase cytochrome b subunit